jgi:hypothetical protein
MLWFVVIVLLGGALFRLSLRSEFTSFAFRVTCHCQVVHEKRHGCGFLSFWWLCSCVENRVSTAPL